MVAILGISAFYHDSAAALVVDGEVVAAAQEERFSRVKHDASFPKQAIDYCLSEAGISAEQLDYVGFYEKPLLKFDRLLETYLAFAPRGYRSFRKAMPGWLKQKLHLPREIKKGLGGKYKKRIAFLEHHEAHAASAFLPSPYQEAAILTVDGVGEWATTCIGVGRGNKIEMLEEIRFPHSLGLLYTAFTYYLGFRVNSGEYKVMGLAPYGKPIYRDLILEHLIDLKEDGSFRMDMSYFNYCQGLTMTSKKFHRLFDSPPRVPESDLRQRDMDLAASIQAVAEEVMLKLAERAYQKTDCNNLVLAGGVALNCVANGRIQRESSFKNVWVQPAAGDAGGALGTAMFIWHQLLDKERPDSGKDRQKGSLLGPRFSDAEILSALDANNVVYEKFENDAALCARVAELLAAQKIVGWFQGRMEFGPRALGNRSILADPRSPEMQSKLNQKIKFRESFRPFAPAVLSQKANEYFDFPRDADSPYMSFVTRVKTTSQSTTNSSATTAPPPAIPAVTHVDQTARVQTVDPKRNPLFRELLDQFERQTACAAIINTSFNVRGEPIVCRPEDALRCFQNTNMDAVAINQFLLLKSLDSLESTPHAKSSQLTQKQSSARLTSLNWNPSDRQLRQFSILLILATPIANLAIGSTASWLVVTTSCAIALGGAGFLRPQWMKPIFVSLSLLALPLGIVVGEFALLAIYTLLLLPLGLSKKNASKKSRSWTDRELVSEWGKLYEQRETLRYFRQS